MLLKLLIVFWSNINVSEFCLLCSIYAPHVKHYALQINQYFIYLNYKILSIGSISSSSTVQHTISNSSTSIYIYIYIYAYKHFEFILNFDKIITTYSPKSRNSVKSVHFMQILSIVLAIFAYYAGIMLNAFAFLLYSKLCWHNRLKPPYLLTSLSH